ncbi:hypothetical protein EDD18DRAFT_4613 [Armillaria luteobubalina]|uniref:Uncharacterized protein n=1 Tax=Armillaria luteobubalina TaxID=153913 RepID=A0AA39U1A6_9AGAR|nr:hypothetical protein EDD18DRAFT_4613 [Armillaria luteobubalina]
MFCCLRRKSKRVAGKLEVAGCSYASVYPFGALWLVLFAAFYGVLFLGLRMIALTCNLAHTALPRNPPSCIATPAYAPCPYSKCRGIISVSFFSSACASSKTYSIVRLLSTSHYVLFVSLLLYTSVFDSCFRRRSNDYVV